MQSFNGNAVQPRFNKIRVYNIDNHVSHWVQLLSDILIRRCPGDFLGNKINSTVSANTIPINPCLWIYLKYLERVTVRISYGMWETRKCKSGKLVLWKPCFWPYLLICHLHSSNYAMALHYIGWKYFFSNVISRGCFILICYKRFVFLM